jgi:hypothetical protein
VAEWRDGAQLAQLVGGYCWAEHRLFTLTGRWAAEPGDAEVRVYLAGLARRHGRLAEAWRDRLPVRDGVDRAALVVPPPGPLAPVFERLAAEPGQSCRLAGLVQSVLPRLLQTYEAHLGTTAPVRESPVLMVLEEARRAGSVEAEVGRSLWRRLSASGEGSGRSGDVTSEIERMFGGGSGVLPGEWAS